MDHRNAYRLQNRFQDRSPGWSLRLFRALAAETVWPTRCALCDRPGTLLCRRCRLALPYLDRLNACPVCGAAWGKLICTECNSHTLRMRGLDAFPLDGCASALRATEASLRLARIYKDRTERRLAPLIAELMADALPSAWREDAVLVPIPARPSKIRARGFDHMRLVAEELAGLTGLPVAEALRAHEIRDQRSLGALERQANMRGAFSLAESASSAEPGLLHERLPEKRQAPARVDTPGLRGSDESKRRFGGDEKRIILIDDAFTTGSTLFSAAETVRVTDDTLICALTLLRV